MHTSNKKKFNEISAKEFDEWCDRWYDFDYDYDCGPSCSCCALPQSAHEEFYEMIAETVADIIIKQQHLNADVKPVLVEERMQAYTAWPRREIKLNDKVREDIAFIWPHIKESKMGRDLFSQIFGQRD
jgi:hypothetical protein